jgi:hypothetical protein
MHAAKILLSDSNYEALEIQYSKRLKMSEYIKIMLEENHINQYVPLYSEVQKRSVCILFRKRNNFHRAKISITYK